MNTQDNRVVPNRREFWLALCAALVILIWNLKNSFEFGRLVFAPQYDDVSYFFDALTRYQRFLNGNVLLLLNDAINNPPHAPFIALQAVLSYMVFGVRDWAPYVSNIWMPFAALLTTLVMTRGLDWRRWVLLINVGTLPMVGASIVEFRPDIAAGILAAAAVTVAVYAVTAPDFRKLGPLCWWAAGLSGAMLWAKPSAAIYNLGLLGLGLGLAISGQVVFRRSEWLRGLRRSLFIVVVGIAASLPYYAIAGRRVVEYTWNAVVRDKEIWAAHMEWMEHAGFYLLGHGGRFMLGLDVWVVSVSVILLLIFARRFESLLRLRLFVLLGVVLGGYLVVAANVVKTHFLGVGFQSLWFMLSFLVLLELARSKSGRLASAGFVLLALVSILALQPAGFWAVRDSAQASVVRETIEQVEEELIGLSQEQVGGGNVFVTFTGFLNRDILSYSLLKRGVNSLRINGWFFRPAEEDPQEAFGKALEEADIVIAAEQGAAVAESGMPSNQVLSLTLSMARESSDFVLLKSIPSGKGSIYIFVRKHAEQN